MPPPDAVHLKTLLGYISVSISIIQKSTRLLSGELKIWTIKEGEREREQKQIEENGRERERFLIYLIVVGAVEGASDYRYPRRQVVDASPCQVHSLGNGCLFVCFCLLLVSFPHTKMFNNSPAKMPFDNEIDKC